jgi:hypothetical protein
MTRYFTPVKWLGGIAAVSFAVAALFAGVITGMVDEATRGSVLFNALPFFFAFVGVLLLFILLIVLVAMRFNGRIPARTYKSVERLIIAGILFGTVCLFNPWHFVPYRYGFLLLLVSTLSFILWSHVLPPRTDYDETLPPFTATQHAIGAALGIAVAVLLAISAITVNAPQAPYGIRERVWNSYDEARRAQIAEEATRSFTQVELPFLVLFNAFPGLGIYLIAREVASTARRKRSVVKPAPAGAAGD